MQKLCDKMGMEFLSTPSGWRATACSALCVTTLVDFYPRPPGGGRLPCCASKQQPSNFYPRPPGGGRQCVKRPTICSLYFYPRPPGGGRLKGDATYYEYSPISIHALRVEGDVGFVERAHNVKISIHALRVEGDSLYRYHQKFLKISIHALRVEGDMYQKQIRHTAIDFYPRPPGGGRHHRSKQKG